MNKLMYRKVRKKWDDIVHGKGDDHGSDDCAFCVKYNFNHAKTTEITNCLGCPIYVKTGERWCVNTPYKAWDDHQVKVHGNTTSVSSIRCSTCLRLAWDFFEFIKSLEKEIV